MKVGRIGKGIYYFYKLAGNNFPKYNSKYRSRCTPKDFVPSIPKCLSVLVVNGLPAITNLKTVCLTPFRKQTRELKARFTFQIANVDRDNTSMFAKNGLTTFVERFDMGVF